MPRAALTPGTPARPLKVPAHIARPEYVGKPAPATYTGSDVQTPETIEKMRAAGALAAQCLEYAGSLVRPGITTEEIDVEAHRFLTERDAYPSPLAYRGYPRATCISLNEVICHGIPDSTVIEDGDIVNIDITAFLDGVHGDTNATFLAGDVRDEARALVEHTEEALHRAIKACAPGRSMNVIGRVIESYARRFGYGVVRAFTGHGVHTAFHSGLVIYHYDNANVPGVMEPGMTFTIEPMITLGGADYDQWDDGWTAVTRDGSWTAQFEHTVLITDDGAEILTLP